jgi:3-phytase
MHLLPFLFPLAAAAAATASLNLTTRTTGVSPKKAALLPSLLIGNDGSAATGGVTAWSLSGTNLTSSAWSLHTGRTKLVSAWNGTAVVTISQEDSFLRVVDAAGEVVGTPRKLWGDFGAVCGWRERALVLVFAKEMVKVVRIVDGTVVVVGFLPPPLELGDGC